MPDKNIWQRVLDEITDEGYFFIGVIPAFFSLIGAVAGVANESVRPAVLLWPISYILGMYGCVEAPKFKRHRLADASALLLSMGLLAFGFVLLGSLFGILRGSTDLSFGSVFGALMMFCAIWAGGKMLWIREFARASNNRWNGRDAVGGSRRER